MNRRDAIELDRYIERPDPGAQGDPLVPPYRGRFEGITLRSLLQAVREAGPVAGDPNQPTSRRRAAGRILWSAELELECRGYRRARVKSLIGVWK